MAKIQTGQVIDLLTFSQAEAKVGDYKYSEHNPADFADEHLGTWMLCNGQSCVGTSYGTKFNKTNVPDVISNGEFIRSAKTGRTVGSLEADENKAHSHTANATAYNVNAAIGGVYFRNTNRVSAGMDTAVGSIANYTVNTNAINTEGGAENRPKNIALNLFVKVGY